MKVVICSHDGKNYFGGPYEWLKRLGPAMILAGVEVEFLFLTDGLPEEGVLYRYLTAQGIKCQGLQRITFSQWHDNTEDRVRWFLSRVNSIKPDVFVANNVPEACYASKWIKEAGIATVGVMHSDGDKAFWMPQEFVSGNPDFSFSALVCVSKYIKEKIYQPESRTVFSVISCGANTSELRSQYKLPFTIVYAGKLVEEAKRIIELTNAFCLAANTIPDVQAFIYGEGACKSEVIEILDKNGNGKVHYGGFVDSNDIHNVLSQAHVIVLLSDYEGLPVILLEGMACGTVPVCLKIPSGIPELVIENYTGFQVENREAAFVEAIRTLRYDQALWERLSDNCMSFMRKEYSMDHVAKQWIELCNEIKSGKVSDIKIPAKIQLPPVNDILKFEDRRKRSLPGYFKQQLQRVSYRLRLFR